MQQLTNSRDHNPPNILHNGTKLQSADDKEEIGLFHIPAPKPSMKMEQNAAATVVQHALRCAAGEIRQSMSGHFRRILSISGIGLKVSSLNELPKDSILVVAPEPETKFGTCISSHGSIIRLHIGDFTNDRKKKFDGAIASYIYHINPSHINQISDSKFNNLISRMKAWFCEPIEITTQKLELKGADPGTEMEKIFTGRFQIGPSTVSLDSKDTNSYHLLCETTPNPPDLFSMATLQKRMDDGYVFKLDPHFTWQILLIAAEKSVTELSHEQRSYNPFNNCNRVVSRIIYKAIELLAHQPTAVTSEIEEA